MNLIYLDKFANGNKVCGRTEKKSIYAYVYEMMTKLQNKMKHVVEKVNGTITHEIRS